MFGRKDRLWILVRDWKTEHFRNKRQGFTDLQPSALQPELEQGYSLLRTLVATPPEALIEYLRDGVKRRALEKRLASAFDPQMRIVPDARTEFLDQARLSDSRFANYKRELALPLARSLPATKQQSHIIFAPDKRCLDAKRWTVPASTRYRGLDRAIELDRMLDALELMRTAILDHEKARHQLLHRGGNHHRVGVGSRLHPRSDVGRIAEHIRPFTTALAHDHRAGLDADPHRQPNPGLGGQPSVQRRDFLDDRQPGAHRALRVVLVRLRPAEVDHQAVAQILGDLPPRSG